MIDALLGRFSAYRRLRGGGWFRIRAPEPWTWSGWVRQLRRGETILNAERYG